LPRPNGYGVSLTTPEGVLVIGGGDATRNFADVWAMRLESGSPAFRQLPPLPVPLAQMAGALAGRVVHVVGGIETPDATTASARHWLLNLDALHDGWREGPPLPAPGRILAVAAAIRDDVYVMAGCSLTVDAEGKPARTWLRDGWRFSGGRWTPIADLPRPATAAASPAPVAGTSLFVVAGDDGVQARLAEPEQHRGFPRGVLRYDSTNDAWSPAGELGAPAPVTLPTAPWKNGFVFFNGEVRPGVRTARVFLFIPGR
jgi:N-acetylneuraminic acid mutarotase